MPNLLTRLLILIEWLNKGNSVGNSATPLLQEAHDRIADLKAQLAAERQHAPEGYAVHTCTGRRCSPGDVRHSAECFADFDTAFNWSPPSAVQEGE